MIPRVVGARALVHQDPRQDMVGSLHVPQGSEHYPPIGIIVAVGSKFYADYPEGERPQVGDRVYFKRHPGRALVQDDREPGERESEFKDLIALDEDDILMVENL